ncbi:MAG: hypothetical protein AB1450_15210 [Pseudomonadota bacterium]
MSSQPQTDAAVQQWQFFRAGDFDQVLIRNGADLAALGQLDKKLWATLSCPVHGLEFDTRTLQFIDCDNDDRIRVPEILAAIDFCRHLLKSLDVMVEGGQALPLELIDDSHDDGRHILASARRILASLGRESAASIGVDDVVAAHEVMAKLPCNGDGVVPPSAVDDTALRAVVEDIVASVGGEADRSGEAGVSADSLAQFFEAAQARLAWLQAAQAGADILPLGDGTAAAHAALLAVREKIDDFFVRCRLAAYDARAAAPLNRAEADYAALAARRLSRSDEALAEFPLAAVTAEAALPLSQGVNPVWRAALEQFRSAVVVPLLGERMVLSEEDWQTVQAQLAPYAAWLAAQPGATLERFDAAQLQALLAGDARARIAALIEQDLSLKPEVEAMEQVERLVRYVRDLCVLLRNYISFADFYSGKRKAIFQAGTLYLDQRSCELCLRVDDAGRHAALASLSRTCLVYCDCRRRGGSEKMTIAAAVTAGDGDGLMAGRNGLFIDRQGNDWDATVTKVIEHPISIRQAFSDPYKKLARFIGAQVEKMAGARAKAVDDSLAAGVEGTARVAEAGKAAPAPFDVAKFAGIFAAIGLALGALGTALAALVTGLLSLAWWQMPLVFVGLILAISGPSMLIAWMKLRQRNLAPLLDANGWAVNTRARINIPFGTSLTALAHLPPGSAHTLRDPFAEQRTPWGWYLLLLVIVGGGLYWLWQSGVLG